MTTAKVRNALLRIIEDGEALSTFIDGFSYEQFAADDLTANASERCLIRMANAVAALERAGQRVVSQSAAAQQIVKLRNELVEQTRPGDLDRVYAIAVVCAPLLRADAGRVLTSL